MSCDWSIIIQTYGNKLPHLERLKSFNDCPIFISNGRETSNSETKQFWWRNCDTTLREFWRKNRSEIKSKKIATIEHDVLVNTKLPEFDPKGVFFPEVLFEKKNPNWYSWRENVRINPSYQLKKLKLVGARPWAVAFWQREALDCLLDPRWDYLYNMDIFCELRTPTVVFNSGFPVQSFDLPNVRGVDIIYQEYKNDFYHPIK